MMNFEKSFATFGFALSLSVITIGGLAAQTSPPAAPASSTMPPAAASSTAPAAPPSSADTGTAAPIKPMHERYLVSHGSAVYAQADTSSAVIGHVHSRKHVTVTGLEGDWLRVKLPHGKVGFIPTKAAE